LAGQAPVGRSGAARAGHRQTDPASRFLAPRVAQERDAAGTLAVAGFGVADVLLFGGTLKPSWAISNRSSCSNRSPCHR
jgi:hypothetical protein